MNNQLLLEFLKHWLNWVESGAFVSNEADYKRYMGLCFAADYYAFLKKENCTELRRSLSIRLNADKLDIMYPFGKRAFIKGFDNCTQHSQHKRLYWVRKTIKELESELCVNH